MNILPDIPTLTVFTCTYNRAHTISRTYESLCRQTSMDFEWLIIDDGSTDDTKIIVQEWKKKEDRFKITYFFKENGGLFSGYNKAIEMINTELCVSIDSDDYMPDDGVERILNYWKLHGSSDYAGIIGLDCYEDGVPVGGKFPENLNETFISNMYKFHNGDVKMVHRVDLLKQVAPVELYNGERFANPIYLFMKVDMMLPMLVTNQNFCFVVYQDANDSMSKNILYQFSQSPKSLARMRLLNMSNQRIPYSRRFRNAIHYVSSCIFSKDRDWLKKSPMKFSTILASPLGLLLYLYISYSVSKKRNSYR